MAVAEIRVVKLRRLESSDQGTFGHLVDGDFVAFSGELPWKNNENDISCIPEGRFECRWTWSGHFRRYMYEVKVPGRVGVRIHSANFMGEPHPPRLKQLEGCVSLGEKIGVMEGQKAIFVSRPAIEKFEKRMGGLPFILEVKNEFS